MIGYYGPGPSIITLSLILNHLKFRILIIDDTEREMLIDIHILHVMPLQLSHFISNKAKI